MNDNQIITFDHWWDTYLPLENGKGGTVWETFGADLARVNEADPDKVWTLIEADGEHFIMNGKHYVNRVGYYITENGWYGDGDIAVELLKVGR